MITTVAPPRRRALPAPSTAVRMVVLLVAAALTLGPVIWTLSTSLRSPAESFTLPPQLIPTDPDFTPYAEVFQQIDMAMLVLNSALVTGLITVGQMLSAALAGYAFARLQFRGATSGSPWCWPP